MFLGHFGVALALKRAEPKLSLGTLFISVQLVDLLWGAFLLIGWERVRIDPGFTAVTPLQFIRYPITHSLVGTLAWALVGAAAYYSWPTRDTSRHWQASMVVGAAVFSHFWLDALVHLPDLTIAGEGTTALGLGLWRSLGATLATELLLFAAGIAIYVTWRSRRHPVRSGRLTGLVLFLLALFLASLFGPPPPDVTTIAVADIIGLLLLAAFAAWVDRPSLPGDL
ncbi:MAG: hypothetical protein H0T68_08175 [Gemmatimonadales bacterium]|nr:hypothetical protein [Gemmatimonadales bacterium]